MLVADLSFALACLEGWCRWEVGRRNAVLDTWRTRRSNSEEGGEHQQQQHQQQQQQ